MEDASLSNTETQKNVSADRTPTQRDRAYSGLRRLLIVQQITEGERLREPEWAQRLGVNRMALREAFARLEAEGLIVKGPRTGYFVPVLSAKEIREILDVRTLLECAAIERICQDGPANTDQLKTLDDACDQFQSLIDHDYLLGITEADRRFHELLIDMVDNNRLRMVYHRAPLPMIHTHLAESDIWREHSKRTLGEHRKIVDALRKGDADLAKQLIQSHLHKYPLPART